MKTFFDIHTHLFNEDYVLRELLSGKTADFIGKLNSNFKRTSELAYKDLKQKYKTAGIYESDMKLIVLTYNLDYIFQEKYASLQDNCPEMQLSKATSKTERKCFTAINNSLKIKPRYNVFLKNNEAVKDKYPNNIYLFYYFDPRRSDSLDFVKNNVRKKGESVDAKKYIGVKIYPQNGYSPLDPEMLKLYEYCQKQDIPITLHFSNAGFSTFANKLEVRGDIMINGVLKKVDCSDKPISKPFTHKFETKMISKSGHIKISNFKKGVKERAKSLNHPFLWHIVLEKYSKLRINFAHFGNGSKTRTNWVLKFIADYPNTYTDLSCASEKEIKRFLKKVNDLNLNNLNLKDQNLNDKVLYGSDYALNELFHTQLREIYTDLPDIFLGNYEKMTFLNSNKFLRFDEDKDTNKTIV